MGGVFCTFCRGWAVLLIALTLPGACLAKKDCVVFSTKYGNIWVKLLEHAAPQHCRVVRRLVENTFYDGATLYRAEPGFVLKGGLHDVDGVERTSPYGPIPLEYKLPNKKGFVTMARRADPDSATSEFFINLKDNPTLDRTGSEQYEAGFTVWGEVVRGFGMAQAIADLPTHPVDIGGGNAIRILNEFVQLHAKLETCPAPDREEL